MPDLHNDPVPPAPEDPPDPPVIEAAFESRCAACDEMIYPGDKIRLVREDEEWVHFPECWEDA